MANESYWTYQASDKTPSFDEIPDGAFNGTAEQWASLSPGYRREIVRTFRKTCKEWNELGDLLHERSHQDKWM